MNHLFSSPTCARDLMNPEALPLRPGKFKKDLALQFLFGQYSGWPVVDPSNKILGVVTELRLLQAVSRAGSMDDLRVEDTMTTPVYVLENESIGVVLNLMVQRQVMRMPVVCDRNLVGVISRGQVVRHCLPEASSSSRLISSCPCCEQGHETLNGSGREKKEKERRGASSFLARQHLESSGMDLGLSYCPACFQTLEALPPIPTRSSPEEFMAKETRPCLLVVDDDPSVIGLLNDALQEWGYDVLMARNGREGLDIVGRRSVNGILLDMHMPIMDGRTMLDELRWLGHQMPVLMMSGGSDERALRQLLQEGAQGFFMKPFHLTSLRQACQQLFKTDEVEEQTSPHPQVA